MCRRTQAETPKRGKNASHHTLLCKRKGTPWQSQKSHLRTVIGIPLSSPVCSWPPYSKVLSWDCLSASDSLSSSSPRQGLQDCLSLLTQRKKVHSAFQWISVEFIGSFHTLEPMFLYICWMWLHKKSVWYLLEFMSSSISVSCWTFSTKIFKTYKCYLCFPLIYYFVKNFLKGEIDTVINKAFGGFHNIILFYYPLWRKTYVYLLFIIG